MGGLLARREMASQLVTVADYEPLIGKPVALDGVEQSLDQRGALGVV